MGFWKRRRRIIGAEKLDRSWQSASQMEEDRREFADGLVAANVSGSVAMAASLVAYPVHRLAAEEPHDRLLEGLMVIADSWLPELGQRITADAIGAAIEDHVDEGLRLVHAATMALGCERYGNLATLYGACLGTGLGPPGVMALGGGLRWDFVEDVERRAFDGEYKDSDWWPQ